MASDIQYKTAREADMALLHPACRADFYLLAGDLQRDFNAKVINVLFKPFETYRHPARQLEAFNQRTSRAGLYQSPHQFGLAVDFVPWDPATERWSWREGSHWEYLRTRAHARRLLNEITWDRAHVESPHWGELKACYKLL